MDYTYSIYIFHLNKDLYIFFSFSTEHLHLVRRVVTEMASITIFINRGLKKMGGDVQGQLPQKILLIILIFGKFSTHHILNHSNLYIYF